jgi:hypothetical protein
MRDDTFELSTNSAAATDKRREPDTLPIDFYELAERWSCARPTAAANCSSHRTGRCLRAHAARGERA